MDSNRNRPVYNSSLQFARRRSVFSQPEEFEMKVLWICAKAPAVAKRLMNDLEENVFGGWLDLAAEKLYYDSSIDFSIVCMNNSSPEDYYHEHSFSCYTFSYSNSRKRIFHALFSETPDIIHIHGSEFIYIKDVIDACISLGLIDRCVISLQGIISECAKHYSDGIPDRIIYSYTFRDKLRHDSIADAQEKYRQRGEYEKKALRCVKHVIGRTEWDKKTVLHINPALDYHFCNETLRSAFYKNVERDTSKIIPHSIFFSQYTSPIKGFHFLLEAMPSILNKFPDTKIYITGDDLLNLSFRKKLSLSAYNKYLISLIHSFHLEKHIVFLGTLPEEEMKKRYSASEVFVSSSVLENSSNSICEAMMCRCPVIASDTGGTPSIITNNEDGILYNYSDISELSDAVCELFRNRSKSSDITEKAYLRACTRHNPDINYNCLVSIYEDLIK